MFVTRIMSLGPVGVTFIGYEKGNEIGVSVSVTEWTERPGEAGDGVIERTYGWASCEKDSKHIPLTLYNTVSGLAEKEYDRYSDMLHYIGCVEMLASPMTHDEVNA